MKLVNWKVFDEAEFNFTEGINLIEGNNYSGKTSFIQALYFGLFNETLYKELTARELKKEGEKDAAVELDVSDGIDEYRIRRNIRGDKQVSISSHLYKLNDRGEEIEELESVSRKKEVLKKLPILLGISQDYVKNINFIQEGSIYQFIFQPKYKIEDDINEMLQLDYLGKIDGFCNEAIKQFEKDIEKHENKSKDIKNFLSKNRDKLESLKIDLVEKESSKEKLSKLIKESKEKIKIYEELEDLESEREDIQQNFKSITENIDDTSQEIEELQLKLDEITKLEDLFNQLRKKVDIFDKNKTQIKNLERENETLQLELIEIDKEVVLLQDKTNQLDEHKKNRQNLENKMKSMNTIKEKLRTVQKELENYKNITDELDEISEKITQINEIIANFKKGECPISHEICPVANELIDDNLKNLKVMEQEKTSLEEKYREMRNPESEYNKLKTQIDEFKSMKKDIEKISQQIVDIEVKVENLPKLIERQKDLKTQKTNIDEKLERIREANAKLEKDYNEYIRVEERIKDKNNLINQIEDKKRDLEGLKREQLQIEKENKIKIKEIEEFKEANKLEDISEIINEQKKIKSRDKELRNNERDIIKLNSEINYINEREKELLEPHKTISELETALYKAVHNKFRVVFFQDTLKETLSELKARKLREIKEICNRMWVKFKATSGMESIDWDEDTFIPYIRIGGHERNIYQLSASERVMVYFSIRAALLSKLGPNYFIIADNLLGVFIKPNQQIILNLLKDVVNKTDINQIIFTGFEISPEFKCENKIKI